MTEIPAATIEAATEAMAQRAIGDPYPAMRWNDYARAALEAAEPLIREAIAQEIEAEAATIPSPPVGRGVGIGLHRAARIVRGEAS